MNQEEVIEPTENIADKYYRHKYVDENNYLKNKSVETYYVPGGLRLNSNYLDEILNKSTYKNIFSQLAISTNSKSIQKSLQSNQKSGLLALKKILQRGDGTFLSPEIEEKLLKKYKIEFNISPLPGDIKPITKENFKTKNLGDFLQKLNVEDLNLKISDKSWGNKNDPFDSEEELIFFKYCKKHFPQSSKWLHPQPKREFFNKEPGTTEGREGVDFLFSPPWRKPIIIEILGKQHFDLGEDFTNPLSSEAFSKDRENLRENIVDCIGIPAYQVREKKGEHFDKVLEVLEEPYFDSSMISKEKKFLITFLEELWSIGAFQNLFFELLQNKDLYCKKIWKLKFMNKNLPTTGLDIFLNFVYSIMRIWDCEELMPEKIVLIDNKNKNFKTYEFNKEKDKYLSIATSSSKVKTKILLFLDYDKTYLQKYPIKSEAAYFFVRKVGFPFKIKDDRSFNKPSPYIKTGKNIEKELKNILKFVFGKSDFRELQSESIQRSLRGESTLVLLPTGSGKSLIYQLSSLLLPGPVMVISPTVALIANQHKNLNDMGIDKVVSITMESVKTPEERKMVLSTISDGTNFLILCAPERLLTPDFENHLKQSISEQQLSIGVIDEAHCISEWGQDFRPSYLGIGERLNNLSQNKELPSLSLTGTASISVRDDILNEVGIQIVDELRSSDFIRPELEFKVENNEDGDKDKKIKILIDFLQSGLPELTESKNLKNFFESKESEIENNLVIIFVPTKAKKTIDIYKKLKTFLENEDIDPEILGIMWGSGEYGKGWDVALGDSQDYKARIPEEFSKGTKKIIIATKAFGMGIDYPNVRCVIHYGIPGSIESWYQEAGRAGRDENDSICWTLFTESDEQKSSQMFKQDSHSKAKEEYSKSGEGKDFMGDDLNTHLYFYHSQWKGVEDEILYFMNFLSKNKEKLLDSYTKRWISYRFNVENQEQFGNLKDDKVIYRLKVLGYLSYWQKDFSARKYNLLIDDFNNFIKLKSLTHWLDRRMPTSTKGFTDKLKILSKNIDKKDSNEVINTFLVQLNDFFPISEETLELDDLSYILKTFVENGGITIKSFKEKLENDKEELSHKIKQKNMDEEIQKKLQNILRQDECNSGFLEYLKKQVGYFPSTTIFNNPISKPQEVRKLVLLNKAKKILDEKVLQKFEQMTNDTRLTFWTFDILILWEIHKLTGELENFDDIKKDALNFLNNISTGREALLICAYSYLVNATYKSVAFERRVKHLQVYELARNYLDTNQLQNEFTNYFADADTDFSIKLRGLDKQSSNEEWIEATKEVKSIENAKYDLEKYRVRAQQLQGWFYAMFYVISKGEVEKIENELDKHLYFSFEETYKENYEDLLEGLSDFLLTEYSSDKIIISYVMNWLFHNYKEKEISSTKAFKRIVDHYMEYFPDEVFENSVTSSIINSELLQKLTFLNKKLIGNN